MELLAAIAALAAHISIRHVLVLNLLGYCIKCVLNHRGLTNWTDAIPPVLMVMGVFLTLLDPVVYEGNYIVYGMANAGCAWLLHQGTKLPAAIKKKIDDRKG